MMSRRGTRSLCAGRTKSPPPSSSRPQSPPPTTTSREKDPSGKTKKKKNEDADAEALLPSPAKKMKTKASMVLPYDKLSTLSQVMKDRLDPLQRGIHKEDAIQVGMAPTSASTCVDCGRIIAKGTTRWGIKYGGNPLPLPVLPLYGTHPMVLWCHGPSNDNPSRAGLCGAAFVRILPHHSDPTSAHYICDAARTCHLCSNAPDNNRSGIRILCGGGPNEHGKIRQHAFHIQCWKNAMIRGAASNLGTGHERQQELVEDAVKQPDAKWKRHSSSTTPFGPVLTYSQLTESEQSQVRRELVS